MGTAKRYRIMPKSHPTGRDADAPSQIPLRGWWQVLKRTYAEASDDNIGLIAAGVAFYGFLAMVPLLASLVLTYGIVVDPAEAAKHIRELTAMVPRDAATLIGEQLDSIVRTSVDKKGFGLLLALGLAIYGAMKGAQALIIALNIVYEEAEKRGFVRLLMLQAVMVVAAVAVAGALLTAISLSAALEAFVGRIGDLAALAVKLLGWLLAAMLASAAVAALYRVAPSRADPRWRWVTPGSVVATLGILATSAGFAWYAASLGDYNATYGSLAGVVVLLLWLWLSAYVLLLGAELNAELERQTERDSTTGPERPLGQRNATMADTVAPSG